MKMLIGGIMSSVNAYHLRQAPLLEKAWSPVPPNSLPEPSNRLPTDNCVSYSLSGILRCTAICDSTFLSL